MDAVDEFFGALPDPDRDHRTIVQQGTIDFHRYSRAISKLLNSDSKDPDHQFLVSAGDLFWGSGRGPVEFRQQISKLALSKSVPITTTSLKDQQLQYYRWIAQGRKDEDCPLSPNVQGTRPRTDVATHACLPDGASKTCSNCGKELDSVIWCGACTVKIHDRMVTRTFYCGKQCQEQHWPHHKKACKARKKLWRAVQLIEALHVKFQTYAFNQVLKTVIVRDGILYCNDRSETECVVTGKSAMQILTRDQTPSEESFLAVIMASKCTDISSICKPLLDTLLKPLGLRIEEMFVVPRNVHRPTCITAEDDGDRAQHVIFYRHSILRVTLPNGEQMAVDFSSPQMGWHETLAPWALWTETRALHVFPPERYGFIKSQEGEITTMTCSEGREGERIRKKLATVMDAAVRDHMARENMARATNLFSLDEARYKSLANALLSSVERSLADKSHQYAQSRRGLKYYDDAWEVCWTLGAAQAVALDDVWLTEAEVRSHGGDEAQLKRIWASRCRGSQKQEQFKALGMNMRFK